MNIAQILPQAGKPIAKPFNRPFTRPFAVLLTGLLSLNAFAQASSTSDDEATVESPAELNELVVTAGLAPLSARDVASSITIITREDIEARQVRFVADILRDVPGFSVNQSGGPGAQTQLRVRGAEANQMLVLVDGVRANDAASTDEFQWQYALTSDVERIEIVRGPQSAIWGSDAVGGVVNIIRRKGSTVNHLGGRAELGSFGTTDLALDGAWAGDNLRLRGGLSYYDTDGINASLVGSEKDGTENTSLSGGLEWQISEALEFLASVQATDATSEFDDFDFSVTGLPQDADRVTEAEQAYWRGELRFAPAGSIWSGNASLNYTDADNLNFSDGALNSRTAAETLEFRARASALLEGARGGQHRFTAGLDYRQTDFLQRGIATDFGDPNQDQSLDVTGLAAEYLGQPFAGLTWTVSGRHDSNSDFDDISTWQIALSHQVQENVRVRGSYGTASKAPTFTERFGFFEDFFLGNPDLKPEESRGYEFGVDTTWFDGVLSLGGAYFSTKLENEINGFAFDPAQGAFTAINNSDDSDRSGFEFVLSIQPGGGLTMAANYTYTDATEPAAGGPGDVREVRRPRHMASVNFNWRLANDRANLNLNFNYTGEQLDVFFDPATFISEQVPLESYLVTDLAGSWRINDSLELVARISNMADEDYQEVLGFARPGRAVYGGLRGRFDF